MPKIGRIGAIALIAALAVQMPARVSAQAAVVVPAGAAIVVIAGIAYYSWINSQGHQILVPRSSAILEDPEESGEWGIYRARDEDHCIWLAAGRDHEWLGNGKCKIKG